MSNQVKQGDGSKPISIYQGAPGDTVKLLYTNWKGNTRERHLQVRELRFGSTQWHAEPQPLLKCLDLEDNAVKDFALSGFRGQPTSPAGSTLSRGELAQALSQAHAAGVKTGMESARALVSTLTLTDSQAVILRQLLGDAPTKAPPPPSGTAEGGGDR